jgi:predicted DNA-binding transcriptional regulator YafY
MPINKNALLRYKILDRCFSNPGRKYFIEDLISECDKSLLEIDPDSCGISRRQIFHDIAFMESKEGWSVELVKHRQGKRVFYRYADMSFSINDMPLNDLEINHLKAAIDILTQFNGMPQFEWIHEMVPKLKRGIKGEQISKPIISFDNNQYLKGIENIGLFYNAIYYNRILQIRYKSFENSEPLNITLHPYFLKQYNNRWFLFGYNPEIGKFDWNLAIDRIERVEDKNGHYQKNDLIDWQEYFEDIIGVTKPMGAAIEEIKLHFFGITGKYIETKPIHGSQKSKWLNTSLLELTINVMINYELEQLILSYAESIKVIKPLKLVKLISKRIKDANNQYA